jgi:hypothetical protein
MLVFPTTKTRVSLWQRPFVERRLYPCLLGGVFWQAAGGENIYRFGGHKILLSWHISF